MSIGIIAPDLEPGSEIGIFSQSGLLVGYAVIEASFTSITLWGDDETTPEIDGLMEGERFILKYWNGEEASLEINSWIEGDGAFATNKIAVTEKLSIINCQLLSSIRISQTHSETKLNSVFTFLKKQV